MVNLHCPVCKNSSQSNSLLFTLYKDRSSFQIVRCESCAHVFTFFDQSVNLQPYYDDDDYQVRDTRDTIFHKIQEIEYQQVLMKLKKMLSMSAPSLLDFGAGKGVFMIFAKQNGFKVKGVETSVPRADYGCKVYDLDISTQEYEHGSVFDTQFDVITLFHVLEHLQNPRDLLQNLHLANLKSTGILLLEVPNFDSWQSRWSGQNWLHLDVPRHLNHFTPQSLKKLITAPGGEIIREEYFSFHLGIIGMIQTIWTWFGYTGFLIGRLKQRKSILLLTKIILTLPFAFILELLAATCKKGGIIRLYIRLQR